jgi:two-component system, OmpR family, response regulator MprA
VSSRAPSAVTPSVLVIEDELALGRMIERVLREEGFAPVLERRGDTGLEAAVRRRPDAVVLDLSLPGLDGLEVCSRLRQRALQMPIIVLTARDAVPDRVRGLDVGADDYLTKPFAIEELVARLRSQLRRLEARSERLQVADLVLEPTARTVSRAGRPISLSVQEFALLELLMRHPNQVMTRRRILDHVWGYDSAPASNVVETYIHYLRNKVDRGEPVALIRTVRSIGYVIGP